MGKEFWSVRHKYNSYADDLFNGTYDECVSYVESKNFIPSEFNLVKRTEEDDYALDMVEGVNI